VANVFCIMRDQDWELPNLVDGLKMAGHNVVGHYDWKDIPTKKDNIQSKNKIFNGIQNAISHTLRSGIKIDLLFFYISGKQITNLQIVSLKKYKIPMLNLSCNDTTNWRKGSGPIASAFDFCWTMTRNAIPKFKGLNDSVFALPLAINDGIYKKKNLEKEYDVIFIGSPISDRNDYISHLINNGISVKIFSSHGNSRPLNASEMVDEYNKAKIALSFTRLNGSDGHEVRLRSFEIPACGTLHLSEYCEEMKDYFDLHEVQMFKDKDELLGLTKILLVNDELREQIALNGYNRTVRDHTWATRYDQVFKILDLKK